MKTNTFEERLDKIVDKLIDDSVEAKAKWHNGGTFTNYQKRLNNADAEAKAAIIDLVLNDVIGETVQLNDIYGNDWRNNYGYNETQVRDAANWLKRKQRAVIKGGNHED